MGYKDSRSFCQDVNAGGDRSSKILRHLRYFYRNTKVTISEQCGGRGREVRIDDIIPNGGAVEFIKNGHAVTVQVSTIPVRRYRTQLTCPVRITSLVPTTNILSHPEPSASRTPVGAFSLRRFVLFPPASSTRRSLRETRRRSSSKSRRKSPRGVSRTSVMLCRMTYVVYILLIRAPFDACLCSVWATVCPHTCGLLACRSALTL